MGNHGRFIIKIVAACFVLLVAAGCASSYRGITADITGCDTHEIRISHAWYGYNRMWTATCRDRTYNCGCRKARCECVPRPAPRETVEIRCGTSDPR